MANIASKPAINVNRGKASHITLVAPTGYTFATTIVESVKDSIDTELSFTVVHWTANSTKKRLRIMIKGRGYPSTLAAKPSKAKPKTTTKRKVTVTDPPDNGDLVITISDPVVPNPPAVDPLPVTYVDDPIP